MKKDAKLDHYFRSLARELRPLPEEARATALAEVKAQVERARAKGRRAADILADLGSAKLTAKAYLKAPTAIDEARSRWVRWLAVGTVAFFGLVLLGGLALIWRLSPVNTDADVRWWGPTLRLDEASGHIRPVENLSAAAVVDRPSRHGQRDLTGVTKVRLPFNTAKLVLNPAEDSTLRWTCEASHHEEPRAEVEGAILTVKLDGADVTRCTFDVPAATKLEVRGVNGHLEINRTLAALDVQLTNGRVSFLPDPRRLYDADVHVKNGLQDFFRRSNSPRATKVKISVTNGTVKRE